MKLKEINQEVIYVDGDLVTVGHDDINLLKQKALRNNRKRIRLCSHQSENDSVHEMLIIHSKGAYVRPHKHLNKSESLHIVEGIADLIFYDGKGKIIKIIQIGDYHSGRMFYCRISDSLYHSLIIYSDFLVFHETTRGPFVKSETIFASWAPCETNGACCEEFMKVIINNIKSFTPTPESPTINGGDEWLSGSEFQPPKERRNSKRKTPRDLSRGVFTKQGR